MPFTRVPVSYSTPTCHTPRAAHRLSTSLSALAPRPAPHVPHGPTAVQFATAHPSAPGSSPPRWPSPSFLIPSAMCLLTAGAVAVRLAVRRPRPSPHVPHYFRAGAGQPLLRVLGPATPVWRMAHMGTAPGGGGAGLLTPERHGRPGPRRWATLDIDGDCGDEDPAALAERTRAWAAAEVRPVTEGVQGGQVTERDGRSARALPRG